MVVNIFCLFFVRTLSIPQTFGQNVQMNTRLNAKEFCFVDFRSTLSIIPLFFERVPHN